MLEMTIFSRMTVWIHPAFDQDGPDYDVSADAETDDYEGPGWQEIALLGAMADEIAEEKRRRDRIRREMTVNGRKGSRID